uniref:Uncharacterized protein n=1 Tax=Globodera pallida TaxID=36090 RepID=A0A183C7R7_GLOPA
MNELSTKQRLLEAIYDKVPEDRLNLNGHFSMDEYKYLKTRHNQILHNDPALSQVLQSLINAETSAKLEMKFDYFDNLLVKKLKQQLAFALIFIAKRNRIQFEHNLTKIDQNDFLQKLTKFLHQSKQCNKTKFGQNCANYPFVTCTKQHSLATCCWRFPEIDDCPSEDEEEYDDKSFKSNEKIKPNFIEFEKDDWLKPYGDEFFS